jgi:hypothetical protein
MSPTEVIVCSPTVNRAALAIAEPDFEARWAAWEARGAAHDREVRGNLIVLVPALAFTAVTAYLLTLMW